VTARDGKRETFSEMACYEKVAATCHASLSLSIQGDQLVSLVTPDASLSLSMTRSKLITLPGE